MEAAHPEAEKASLILVLLFTWAFLGALKKLPNDTILSQPAKQDWLPTTSRSALQQFNFTTPIILERNRISPTLLAATAISQQEQVVQCL